MKKTSSKTKKILSVLAGISFLAGFVFLNKTPTGNIILNEPQALNPFSLIGLLLVMCSAVLAIWVVKKR